VDQTVVPIHPHVTAAGAITFDGRIDNREGRALRQRGDRRVQASDAELALAAYQRAGGEGLISLIGDWSLAIFDRVRRRVVLASDFAGVRPLYYSASGSHIRWSTRLKPLACGSQTDEVDDEYVAGLLVRGGCPHRTPYRGVCSVPPGHFLVASAQGIDIRPFWTLPIGDSIRYTHESDYQEHLRDLFRDAVRCRTRTSGPVLSELSGGLDSSSIVCMAKRLVSDADVKARFVTLTYEREGSRDKYFRQLLESFDGFERAHLSTSEHAFLTESCTGGALPAFWEQLHLAIAKLAQDLGARTLLTGSLGDLIMGNWWDDSAQVLRLFRTGHWPAALRESLAWSQSLGIPIAWVLGRAAMSALPPSLAGSMWEGSSDGLDLSRNRDNSIAPAFRARMGLADRDRSSPRVWAEALPERRKHFRGLSQTLELRRLQPPEPLEHLAYTHPYSHRPLVQFMLSIPADIVCGPGEPRRLMRRALQGLWPPELCQRRSKDSFGGVFLDSIRPLAAALLRKSESLEVVERGYVDPVSLKERLERITHSLDCNESQLRQIILFEYWLRGHRTRLQAGA
jgi:asparagine synthase (glutamine-hydrolysing)